MAKNPKTNRSQDSSTKKSTQIENEEIIVDATAENIEAISTAETEKAMEEEMVQLSKSEYEAIGSELEESKRKNSEYFDGWARERADFANFKKRVEREQITQTQSITGNIIKKYLPVIDDMERAMKNRPADGDGAKWAEGIELIYRKLQNILDSEGVKRIEAEKEIFDPTRHEAITYEANPDHGSGEIIEVLQQGYMIGDRVIRPALVRVAQ